MNSENETSPTTPPASNSKNLSQTAESSPPTNITCCPAPLPPLKSIQNPLFETDPLDDLVGTPPKPMESMTEEELRAFIQTVQINRQSLQTFKASIASSQEKKEERQREKDTIKTFDDLL